MLRNIFNRLINTINEDGEKTRLAAEFLGRRVMELICAKVNPYDYPDLFQIFIESIKEDGVKCLIIPDMDYQDIWYTSKPEIINLCNALGIGDATLTHWPEEDNKTGKYLELTKEELASVYSLIFFYMVREEEEVQPKSFKEREDQRLIECLKILDANPGVSIVEIKKVYKELVQVWHPDRFANNPNLAKRATEKMKEINEAYSYICQHYSDP